MLHFLRRESGSQVRFLRKLQQGASKLLAVSLLCAGLNLPSSAQGPINPNADEVEAQQAVYAQKYVRLRELASKMIEKSPERPGSFYYYGYSLHHSEGDLPRARFYLEKAERVFIEHYGAKPSSTAPWGWLDRILLEMESVQGEMDDYQAQIDSLERLDALFLHQVGRRLPALRAYVAWPLMKLGKETQARKELSSISMYQDEGTRVTYLNSLGALEMETDHPAKCYETFTDLVNSCRRRGWNMTCTYLRNAGEASATVGKFDEAEKYFLDATNYFDPQGYSNPWWDLGTLYLSQARFPEAVTALKNTVKWTAASQPYIAQQSWAADQQLVCEVLLQLGMTKDALVVAENFINQPDRKGGDSVSKDQTEAANLLIYRDALLARQAGAREELCWSKGKQWWSLLAEQHRLGWQAYFAGRRATAMMIEHGRLHSSLRWSLAHGTVTIPNYARPELAKLYGPAVTLAAIEEQNEKKWDGKEFEQPYLASIAAEAQALSGQDRLAVKTIETASRDLPKSEALLKLRLLALKAQIQERQGQTAESYRTYQQIMEQAPSMLRTLDISLPVQIQGSGSMLSDAASMLTDSPRFRDDSKGLKIQLTSSGGSLNAVLLGLDGSVINDAEVKILKDTDQTARDLVAEVHTKFFAPRVDLSQVDINSLDGSTRQADSKALKKMFGF
jgi:hypothetical protein